MRYEITLGDGVAGMLSLPEKSVSVFCTSPPYARGKDYGKVDDSLSWPDYCAWMRTVVDAMDHALADDGSIFFNHGSCPSRPWESWDVANLFRKAFRLQNTIIWVQSIAIGERTYGHYQPVGGSRFLNDCHEYIFHFTRHGATRLERKAEGVGVPYTDKSNQKRWKSGAPGLHCRGNTWFVPYETTQGDKGHACPFPMELPRRCLKLHGLKNISLVCDPFVGSGTTILAAQELGVDCIGWEKDFSTFLRTSKKFSKRGK